MKKVKRLGVEELRAEYKRSDFGQLERGKYLERVRRRLLITCAVLPTLVPLTHAQEPPYPQRGNVEITVLFPAGTSADVTARLLAEGMSKHLGQTVLVVNRPGAGGAIGYKHVASQKPDGYSLVWNSNSISTTYHSGQLAFDYKAFDPVARVLVESPVVAVRGDAKWKSLGDLMADAKARPGIITVGNSGIGSHTHISSVALFHAAGVKIVDVPYAAAQVVPNLLGGHVDVLVQLPGALAAQVKSGNVRLLATMIPARDPALPDVPTAKEQGIDVSLEAWRGIAVPRGTPAPVVVVLENAIRQTAESPEFARSAEKLGVRPAYMPAAEFGELIAKEDAQLAQLMILIGLKK
jgi:tripartite-type tricarboxylate transporter receptor subunit TctC